MTITSILILLATCLGVLMFSFLQPVLLKRLMQPMYHKKVPQVIRANVLQILILVWMLLLFAIVLVGSHYLSWEFGIPKQAARLSLALCLIVPMGYWAVRLAAEQDRKKRESKTRRRL